MLDEEWPARRHAWWQRPSGKSKKTGPTKDARVTGRRTSRAGADASQKPTSARRDTRTQDRGRNRRVNAPPNSQQKTKQRLNTDVEEPDTLSRM